MERQGEIYVSEKVKLGMIGIGYQNLYRSISYRTTGGSCVQNREIEDGGPTHRKHLKT